MATAQAETPVPWGEAKAGRRIVIVRATSPNEPRLQQQRQRWSKEREGLRVREVEIWEWLGSSIVRRWPDGTPLDVQGRLLALDPALGSAEWRVVLLGRDGGAKAAWDKVVEPAAVFDLIDAMPMGRREKSARDAAGVRP